MSPPRVTTSFLIWHRLPKLAQRAPHEGGVAFLLGHEVVDMNVSDRKLMLDDGREVAYLPARGRR